MRMDDTLDVDELVSQHLAVGSETNLSALSSAADQLERRTENVKRELYRAVRDFYGAEPATGAAAECDGALAALPAKFDRLQPELAELAAAHRDVDAQVHAIETAIDVVRHVASLGSSTTAFDSQLASGAVAEAATTLLEQETVLHRLRELEGLEETAEGHSGSAVIAGLQATVADRRARLEALLTQLLSTAVVLRRTDDGGGSLKVHAAVQLDGSTVQLTAIWAGMDALGMLSTVLERWGVEIHEVLLTPTLRGASPKEAAEKGGARELTWPPPLAHIAAPDAGRVRAVTVAMQFVTTVMLEASDGRTWAAELGASLWPAAAEAVVVHWLHSATPSAPSELGAFRAAATCAGAIERAAEGLGLAASGSESDGVVGAAIASMEAQYAVGRRRAILAQARAVLLQPGYDTVMVGGEEEAAEAAAQIDAAESIAAPSPSPSPATPSGKVGKGGKGGRAARATTCEDAAAVAAAAEELLLPEGAQPPMRAHRCEVSRATKELVTLLDEALLEASQSGSPTHATEVSAAVMDAVDLFRAMVPVARAAHTTAAPHLGMLYRNDCHFLALHLLQLQYRYGGGRLRTLLRDCPLPLAGLAPALTAAGEAAEARCLRRRAAAVEEALDDAVRTLDGIADDPDSMAAAHRSVQRAMHQVRCDAAAWRTMLPARVLRTSLARLYETLCGRLVAAVLRLHDISVDETAAIQELLAVVLEGDALRGDGGAAAGEASGGAVEVADADAEGLEAEILLQVPSWLKLKELATLVDSPLVDITRRWQDGVLAACGFAAQEIHGLICAIFEPTSLRKECLEHIQ